MQLQRSLATTLPFYVGAGKVPGATEKVEWAARLISVAIWLDN